MHFQSSKEWKVFAVSGFVVVQVWGDLGLNHWIVQRLPQYQRTTPQGYK